jgi:tRNA-modifying protein YgfZ
VEQRDDLPWWGARRDIVTVSGSDALTYLQSQLSQELRDLLVGESRWTFLLEPTGKIDVLARLTRTDDDMFALETDAGFGPALLARLDRFKIRVEVDTALLEAEPGDLDPDAERARIEAGWPRMGAEIVPGETIPAETGLSAVAVNHQKGCYPGQELVERMDSRGVTPPRSLRRFTVAAGAFPGDPVVDAEGTEVGVLTSVSGTIALGYVKRGAELGEPVTHS